MNGPGRVCPAHYRYGAAALAAAAERKAQILYVIGGLYGNLPALDAVEAMAAAEDGPVTLCFNGDFNWFNVDPVRFAAINRRVLARDATLGNVEAELVSPDDGAGCGCAYPDTVDDALVERSNRIHRRLAATAGAFPEIKARLAELPMVARYRIGGCTVGVVHGDAESLAGWQFDARTLGDPSGDAWRLRVFRQARVDVFASSHTCLPALRRFELEGAVRCVANNGAAGMPNFVGERTGMLTRVGTGASPHPPLHSVRVAGAEVAALAIPYDHELWMDIFLAGWPEGSTAWQSYARRMLLGPDHRREAAFGTRLHAAG